MKPVSKSWKALASLLALVLVCFMTVEVAHGHPANDPSGQHCQICAMAHMAIENHPIVFTQRIEHVVAAVIPAEARAGSRYIVFTRFIRPPPAVSTLFA